MCKQDSVEGTIEKCPPRESNNIQNYYFLKKISITYLGRTIENTQLFVPLIIIISWGLHLSLLDSRVHDFSVVTELPQPLEHTSIFSIIANTLGQFDPVHFWLLIIPQLLNLLTQKFWGTFLTLFKQFINIISASEVFFILTKICENFFLVKKLFFLTLNYSCKAAVPPFFKYLNAIFG